MTANQYFKCILDAKNYPDVETYLSEYSRHPIWNDPEGFPIPEERISQLRQIWQSEHRTMAQICEDAGITHKECAQRFQIPERTMEDWCRGVRKPPRYVLSMIQLGLGLLNVETE